MEPEVITVKVKQIIGSITGISPEGIGDTASFVDDLGLDSLAILEIVVDVEKAFKIGATDEELQSVRSIQDTVNLILQRTCAQVA
jgi:acyl carrier protein